MNKITMIKNSLTDCIKNMSVEKERFVRNPLKDFIRNSKCNIETTTRIILGFEDQCLNSELKNYYRNNLSNLPYKSTFVQQRDKFSDDAFLNLFSDFNFKHPFKQTKYGLHLLAVDGSDLNLPTLFTDNEYFVENHTKNDKGFYQLHLNALYDILEDRFVDVVTQPRPEFNEGLAINLMVDRAGYSPNSALYIGDRNYFALNVLAHITNANQYYLIRCKNIESKNSSLHNMNFPDSKEFDVHKNIKIIRSSKKCYKSLPDEYKCISNDRAFDFIEPHDNKSTFRLNFRVVSIVLPNGSCEYLVTNLPEKKFPPEVLKILYKERWKEESAFHKLKYKCGLNWFHSIKRKFIIQEIYAKLIMYNFSSLLAQAVDLKKVPSLKHHHTIAFANVAKLARMFLNTNIAAKLIKTLILMESPPVRTNRIAPRNVRSQRVNPLNTRV